VKWPVFGPGDGKASMQPPKLFAKLYKFYWGSKKIGALSKEEKKEVRQKIVTYVIFHGKKPWDPSRQFAADYMNVAGAAGVSYKQAVQALFSHGGDSVIHFADDVIKVNRKGQSQHQVVVVTDKHIYKYTPGKFKMIKSGEGIDLVESIHFSPNKDTFLVIHMKPPARDMVLDLGTNGCERFSELATILVEQVNHPVPVTFTASTSFNNSRTPSSQGSAFTLTYEQNKKSVDDAGKAASSGSRFIFGKAKGTAIIHYA